MDEITVKEASERWGYTEGTICKWCRKGLIMVTRKPEKKSGRWFIPADAECPKPIKKTKKERN